MTGEKLWINILVFTSLIWCTFAKNVFVVAPNTFRLGANETVGIFVAQGLEEVTLSLQDYPGRKNTFSVNRVQILDNDPQVVQMRVSPENIPDLALSSLTSKHYVLLIVESRKFRKEVKVLVNLQGGYLFVQTDKPIYTPKQTVHIRIIPLKEDMLIDEGNFTVEIRNPQNVIVEHTPSTKLNMKNGLYNHNFPITTRAMEGDWSLVIKYGHKIPRNETLVFEVKEYSLPTYEVRVKAPEVILPNSEVVEVDVEAKYVYGQIVEGSVKCKFAVMSETKKKIYLGSNDLKILQDGKTKCRISRESFETHKDVGWFPGLAGRHLVVEAVVTEKATGENEMGSSSHTLFSSTKYIVDFKRSLRDFKPGLIVSVMANIKEATGKKATNVVARIEVKDQHGRFIRPINDQFDATSDEEGVVGFLIPTTKDVTSLHIMVVTEDLELEPRLQGKSHHMMLSQNTDLYVLIDRSRIPRSLKVGESFRSPINYNVKNLPMFYVATSGGRLVSMGILLDDNAEQRVLQLHITDQMVPSVRITLFTVHGGKTITDSIKIEVEKECRAQAKIVLENTFANAKPGSEGTITVRGTPDTVVGILAVDKAVYALRNKGHLTKDKMFAKMEEHDLGCGPGGGIDAHQVLANAGLLILSDSSTSVSERLSCSERKLRKREIREEVLKEQQDHKCCKLAMAMNTQLHMGLTCMHRFEVIQRYHRDDNCAEVFLQCCLKTHILHNPTNPQEAIPAHANAGPPISASGRIKLNEDLDFVQESDDLSHEESTPERKDFRETWIFDTGVIGADMMWKTPLNVPHSITTWMIQAVGVNPTQGMCVADPVEAVIFQRIFIQMKLPYSVVRNEQIEIRATVFNYGTKRLPVVVYMYGVEGLCAEAQPNEKGERKKIYVSGNGGAETVAFPVVPLEVGKFVIQVVAVSAQGNDKISKTLNVVAEGIPHVENIVVDIDPGNLVKRQKRRVASDKYESHFVPEQKKQFSTVSLLPTQQYVPGTETCLITAIGDKFGPVVHIALNNPDKLIRLPQGCGEQTIALLAPTLYTLHYLKITGKLMAQQETNAYKFVRDGYKRELNFRKEDGSYAAFPNRPSSTWLTAFVAKIFCQASKYVFIDENTICSALNWLVDQQGPNGTFIDQKPVIHHEMTGGVKGVIPMTAFALNALYKCDCNHVNLTNAKEKAVRYLIEVLPTIDDPYQLSIVTYALSLADPAEAGYIANQRLLAKSHINQELNLRYWGQPGTPLSVEATSFALLTQLIHSNKDIATSIVNWLNTQRTTEGSFWSTQDTVIALEALAEYSIYAREAEMSLSCNLTSSSDLSFKETIDFRPENARVLRSYELKQLGGKLHLDAEGTGASTLGVQLRYNIPTKLVELCKFEIVVNVSEAKEILKPRNRTVKNFNSIFDEFDDSMLDELGLDSHHNQSDKSGPLLLPPPPPPPPAMRLSRVKDIYDIPQDIQDLVRDRQRHRFRRSIAVNPKVSNSKYVANISICVKYLYHQDSNMAVLDTGIFTGFTVDKKDLKRIVDDPDLPVARYDEAGRSIVFYLDQVSHRKPVCFWFTAVREFIVSNMESSVIKVYDYYKPEHTCTQFYSPNQHSAIIQTECTEKVCKCAEGGCAPKEPFKNILKEIDTTKQRNELTEMACDDHDYVWKVKVENVQNDDSSFRTVDVKVIRVLREGRETRQDIFFEPQRKFLVRKTCVSGQMDVRKTYIVMGKDQEPVQQPNGDLMYTYYIGKNTMIYEWFDVYDSRLGKSKQDKNLQKVFMWLEKQLLKDEGCIH